jgi:cell wall-associated NlpC family hydrolase
MKRAAGMQMAGVALLALAAAACATGAGSAVGPRPSPFPGVGSPASIRPAIPAMSPRASPDAVLQTALTLQGVPYRWGGDSPDQGFDCSGFVRYVLGQHQFPAPRTAVEQFQLGTRVDLSQLRAGDLVFFSTVAPGASHVGLAINGDEFVHAPAASGVVRTERVRSPYWHTRFVGARRIL